MVVLLVERFIFPLQYSNMSNRSLEGADVYPWISNSNLPKQGMTDLEEYRCLLYSAAPISQDGAKAAEEMERSFFFFFLSFRGGDGDAVCILTTCPLSALYCIQFTLIDFFFSMLPLKSVDGF